MLYNLNYNEDYPITSYHIVVYLYSCEHQSIRASITFSNKVRSVVCIKQTSAVFKLYAHTPHTDNSIHAECRHIIMVAYATYTFLSNEMLYV
jgi:hypothetical protein